jgi:hypothetical protein
VCVTPSPSETEPEITATPEVSSDDGTGSTGSTPTPTPTPTSTVDEELCSYCNPQGYEKPSPDSYGLNPCQEGFIVEKRLVKCVDFADNEPYTEIYCDVCVTPSITPTDLDPEVTPTDPPGPPGPPGPTNPTAPTATSVVPTPTPTPPEDEGDQCDFCEPEGYEKAVFDNVSKLTSCQTEGFIPEMRLVNCPNIGPSVQIYCKVCVPEVTPTATATENTTSTPELTPAVTPTSTSVPPPSNTPIPTPVQTSDAFCSQCGNGAWGTMEPCPDGQWAEFMWVSCRGLPIQCWLCPPPITPTPTFDGAIPEPPSSGTYVLASVNGQLTWLSTENC